MEEGTKLSIISSVPLEHWKTKNKTGGKGMRELLHNEHRLTPKITKLIV